LGNLLSSVLGSPGLWPSLAEDPSQIPDVVRESLRWETPIAVLPRISASFDMEFEGVHIPADSWTLFAIAAANRDPDLFPNPDRFDPSRFRTETRGDESLTFGRGTKACPGMHLARKNMEVAFRVLLERLPNLELIDHEAALPRRTVLRCPDALRVRR
jgi:cytochrome P450